MAKSQSFGCNLRRLREEAGLSVAELARVAGLSRQYIHRLENGQHEPPLETVTRLADALACDLALCPRRDNPEKIRIIS
jgi:transcriptional regulator with XRE-family HTH domain